MRNLLDDWRWDWTTGQPPVALYLATILACVAALVIVETADVTSSSVSYIVVPFAFAFILTNIGWIASYRKRYAVGPFLACVIGIVTMIAMFATTAAMLLHATMDGTAGRIVPGLLFSTIMVGCGFTLYGVMRVVLPLIPRKATAAIPGPLPDLGHGQASGSRS